METSSIKSLCALVSLSWSQLEMLLFVIVVVLVQL